MRHRNATDTASGKFGADAAAFRFGGTDGEYLSSVQQRRRLESGDTAAVTIPGDTAGIFITGAAPYPGGRFGNSPVLESNLEDDTPAAETFDDPLAAESLVDNMGAGHYSGDPTNAFVQRENGRTAPRRSARQTHRFMGDPDPDLTPGNTIVDPPADRPLLDETEFTTTDGWFTGCYDDTGRD